MNDQDYIRKAVKLADGWKIRSGMNLDIGYTLFINGPERYVNCLLHEAKQYILDALAAQLVRQVDALGGDIVIDIEAYLVTIWVSCDSSIVRTNEKTDDRAMNTIKAIVDSGVLE